MPTRTRILIGATTVAALVAAALPGSAPGQGTGPLPNWPELLPPNPTNSAEVVSPGFDAAGFLERAAVKPTRRSEVSFEAEGWQRASLKLTRRGRRALARRGPARVSVALDAPYGFGVQATHTLR